jgi:folate-dependent phosphoribosylglycinamide formyltransferase PurN
MKKLFWVTFFSQSGKEICDISDKLGFYPDIAITDNNTISKLDPRIINCNKLVIRNYRSLNKLQKINYYTEEIPVVLLFQPETVITLHGWLNIVPAQVCKVLTGRLYNGHPGLIDVYDELKGKDPQVRCFNNIGNYDKVGSVVHAVTPELDAGEILVSVSTDSSSCTDLESTFKTLSLCSLTSWITFFNERRYNKGDEHIRN